MALQLLDAEFADLKIRNFAVEELLSQISIDQLQLILLQLVQCIKYQAYHSSTLTEFFNLKVYNIHIKLDMILFGI